MPWPITYCDYARAHVGAETSVQSGGTDGTRRPMQIFIYRLALIYVHVMQVM